MCRWPFDMFGIGRSEFGVKWGVFNGKWGKSRGNTGDEVTGWRVNQKSRTCLDLPGISCWVYLLLFNHLTGGSYCFAVAQLIKVNAPAKRGGVYGGGAGKCLLQNLLTEEVIK